MKITLDWIKYEKCARQAIAEGCVLLENNGALPLSARQSISVFGRIQSSYYKSGTGSGGKVNVAKVYNLLDGFEDAGLKINKDLQKIYADWEIEHPYDEGFGWGKERWSQDEMPLTEKIVEDAAKISDVAIVIIGRTAGEDKDNSATKGSFLLTDEEMDMLSKVRKGFKKVVVLLNVGNIIDMSFVDECKPDAVMYVWQGGMLGGLGTADVLVGKVNPCGKLTDTIAFNIEDYPTTKYFGNPDRNFYSEDIFCGYRYFETFSPESVRYPFGFGLSYTTFKISGKGENIPELKKIHADIEVCNTGKSEGKEVVQIYVQAPCGKLGKAKRVLVDFGKTEGSVPAGSNSTLSFDIPYYNFASYDDSGKTGYKSCWVLEAGNYSVYAGSDVRKAKKIFDFNLEELLILKKCEETLAPEADFERMGTDPSYKLIMEKVPTASIDVEKRRIERIPAEILQTSSNNIKLADVLNKKADIKDFVAQLSDEDLSCIIRGEGMGSSLVTPGTASAFGGVSPRLRELGIPVCCCDDGPSGMRLDCGIKAFSLPNGTCLASTFNKDLIAELYTFTGLEMQSNKVENLLGPGMNIHRNPLNGRNFEYFSEDPFVTGVMGSAMLKGLHQSGVTGTIKHFAGNEQEKNRYATNSVVSERALREVYLKGFEIAVASGYADSVMTTYGVLNDLYTAGSYDLNTTILRNDWGFNGIVMTDWWASINDKGQPGDKNNFAAMVRAQNDLYMVCPDGSKNITGDNTLSSLDSGSLKRGELQRCAINICNHVMNTVAMKRLMGTADEIEIINRPKAEDDINLDDIEFTVIDKNLKTIDLTYQECKANANYILAFDVSNPGTYKIELTGSSELSELAQLPCTLSIMGIPIAGFVFNGSGGKEVTIEKEVCFRNRFAVCRLFVASNGLKLKDIKISYVSDEIKYL